MASDAAARLRARLPRADAPAEQVAVWSDDLRAVLAVVAAARAWAPHHTEHDGWGCSLCTELGRAVAALGEDGG